jgi:hypothetical protein
MSFGFPVSDVITLAEKAWLVRADDEDKRMIFLRISISEPTQVLYSKPARRDAYTR